MTAEDRLAARIGIRLESRHLESDVGRLHCKVGGSGPALMLIHGLNIGWGQWYAAFRQLADKFTVYALDLPGAGQSVKPDFLNSDMPSIFLKAVEAALREFCPAGCVLAGHSVGGWIALRLASQRHPLVRGLVAVDAMGFTDYVPPRYWALSWRPLVRLLKGRLVPPTAGNLASFLSSVTADRKPPAPEFLDYYVEHVNRGTVSHPFVLIHSLFQPATRRIRPEMVLSDADLAAIACPVTVLHGAEDPLIPPKAVRPAFSALPDARVVILDQVGHAAPLEAPEKFVRVILESA